MAGVTLKRRASDLPLDERSKRVRRSDSSSRESSWVWDPVTSVTTRIAQAKAFLRAKQSTSSPRQLAAAPSPAPLPLSPSPTPPTGILDVLEEHDRQKRLQENALGSSAEEPIDLDDSDDEGEALTSDSPGPSKTKPIYPPIPHPTPAPPILFSSAFDPVSNSQSNSLQSSSSFTPVRPPPSRPDLNYRPPVKKIAALDSSSTTSSTSSGSSRRPKSAVYHQARHHKAKRAMTEREVEKKKLDQTMAAVSAISPNDDSRMKRITNIMKGKEPFRFGTLNSALQKNRKTEQSHMKLVQDGEDSLANYRNLLLKQNTPTTLNEKIQPSRPPTNLEPKQKNKIAQESKTTAKSQRDPDIIRYLEDLRLKDQEVQDRLKPKTPTALPKDKDQLVDTHLRNAAFLAQCSREEVRHASLVRLRPSTWLDDEIMNFYGALLTKRAAENQNLKKIHFFSSFFYFKLSKEGYEKSRLKRWTKGVDIFAKDLVVFPINQHNSHWTAAAINFEKKRIEYYDSMGDYSHAREQLFEDVRDYLQQEHLEKKNIKFDLKGWTDVFNPDTPQQDNGSDCGVFSCQTLEALARGKDLVDGQWEFSAQNMAYFRRLMVLEIAQSRLEARGGV